MILESIVKWDLSDNRRFSLKIFLMKTKLLRKHKHRRFRWITGNSKTRVFIRIHDAAIKANITFWFISNAADIKHLFSHIYLLDNQFVFGDCTGFVNGDNTGLS